jgi:hypothetical protein
VKNFFKILLIFEEGMCYNQSRGKERDVPKKITRYGALAQLGERYTGSVEVSGSNPLCSTIKINQRSLFTGCAFCVDLYVACRNWQMYNITKEGVVQ